MTDNLKTRKGRIKVIFCSGEGGISWIRLEWENSEKTPNPNFHNLNKIKNPLIKINRNKLNQTDSLISDFSFELIKTPK